MKYYFYNDDVLAKRKGVDFPEILLKDGWERLYDLERFSMDSEEISKEVFDKRLANLSESA